MRKAALSNLPRQERLRKGAEVEAVFRCGAVAKGRWLIVRAMGNGRGFSRVAIAVGKAAGGAVTRNRLRRRLRAAYRAVKELLPAGWDLVLQCRPAAGEAAFADLAADLQKTVERVVSAQG